MKLMRKYIYGLVLVIGACLVIQSIDWAKLISYERVHAADTFRIDFVDGSITDEVIENILLNSMDEINVAGVKHSDQSRTIDNNKLFLSVLSAKDDTTILIA